jgi:putative heme-binding domain-containing protein
MLRKWSPSLFLLAGLVLLLSSSGADAIRFAGAAAPKPAAKPVSKAEQPSAEETQWVWFNEGDPTVSAPAETRYFRRVFAINRPVPNPIDEAQLDITADNAFTVWVNGVEVGKGDDWMVVKHFDVKKLLVDGKNVVAVEASNSDGPAGLMVRLGYTPNGQSKLALCSDDSWKTSKTAGQDWQKMDFEDTSWGHVKALGAYGKTAPWEAAASAGNPRFSVPEGFRVEMAAKNPDPKDVFSLVNMTFDDKGRLLVSQENGPILLCTDPDKDGVLQSVRPYCSIVTNCQGMCWVGDALMLVGAGPDGVGLYRCRDTKGKDVIDEATLVFAYAKVKVPGYGEQGGMAEHGPHAVLNGPDGAFYVVNGNHSWPKIAFLAANSPLLRWPHGQMGPDQDQPGSNEDTLLPRLNDANGHATNIRAPGGCIWRIDPDGKNPAIVACGFRNAFDAAFRLNGELFTFDSDMEWDEDLPWYRPVRVNHCPPGADFVWRTGSANTPAYYIDSLPAIYDVGRGSPVGLEFYEHTSFPPKYQGAYLMADWSLGVIYAAHLKPGGASYKVDLEKFCTGAPMNVTDIGVAPDGSVYFTMGGRHTQGGVYRIVYDGETKTTAKTPREKLLSWPQPQAGWSRAALEKWIKDDKIDLANELLPIIADGTRPAAERVKALMLMQMHGRPLDTNSLASLVLDRDPLIRAQAVYLIGVNNYRADAPALTTALKDDDAFVRRRACEAFVRCNVAAPLPLLWPLLGDSDRFVRTAARLCLQRAPVKDWAKHLWTEENDLIFMEGVVALCKIDQAAPYAEQVFDHLHKGVPEDAESQLQYLRTVELALLHTPDDKRPGSVRGIALECEELFPTKDWRVNRELALVMTYCRRDKMLGPDDGVEAKIIQALLDAKGDRQQQIHYFYCLRFLPDGWTPAQKKAVAEWYEGTHDWKGGNSFSGYLLNIFKEALAAYNVADRTDLLKSGDKTPTVTLALARCLQDAPQPPLAPALLELAHRLPLGAVRGAVDDALAETALKNSADNSFADLVEALNTPNPVELFKAVEALKKQTDKPKPEDAAAYRAALLAARRLGETDRWKVVELLRVWSNGKQFGANDGDWKTELGSWSKWFNQTFPKEPPLPNVAGDRPVVSKYKYDELLTFLIEKEGKSGDPAKGKEIFTKDQCIKCHKYGKDGEGVGPDLSNVSKRFKRPDILESIYYPSKAISDQYRSTQFLTKQGQTVMGLASLQGDVYTVLQKDGTKVILKKDEVDQQYTSLISVMPEGLLDQLEKKEIADLFAFLESEPAK